MKRLNRSITLALLAAVVFAWGCASNGQRAATTKASPSAIAAFDQLKALSGDWEMDDG